MVSQQASVPSDMVGAATRKIWAASSGSQCDLKLVLPRLAFSAHASAGPEC